MYCLDPFNADLDVWNCFCFDSSRVFDPFGASRRECIPSCPVFFSVFYVRKWPLKEIMTGLFFFICYRTKRVKMQIRRQKGLRDLTDWTLQSDACSYTGWWHSYWVHGQVPFPQTSHGDFDLLKALFSSLFFSSQTRSVHWSNCYLLTSTSICQVLSMVLEQIGMHYSVIEAFFSFL